MPNIAPAASGAPNFTQGLLASLQPWLTGSSPSALDQSLAPMGGTLGLLSILGADGPGSQGVENAARMMQTVQDDALHRAAVRQSMAGQQIGLAQKAMMLPFMRAYLGAAMGGGNGAGAPGAAPSAAAGSAPGGMPAAVLPGSTPAPQVGTATVGAAGAPLPSVHAAASNPSMPPVPVPLLLARSRAGRAAMAPGGAVGSSPQSTAPAAGAQPVSLSRFAIPTPGQIGAIPIGGMPSRFYQLGALLSGGNPLTTATQIQAEQVKLAQQQYGPVLAQLDTLDKAQSPAQYVQASPTLQAEWAELAPTLGFDPVKGFTDANVRTAFSFLRNRIAGGLGEPTVAPPVQLATTGGPLNSIFQRNPITGQIQQVKPEEALKAIVGPNGNVHYVAASEAAGATPYESQLYAPPQAVENTASMIANYEMAPLNGYALRTPIGAEIMAAVKKLNPSYDATTYQTKQTARTAFATGKQGNIVRSLSVATNHLDQLAQAAHALAQGNIPAVNALVNTYSRHTGSPGVTSFSAMREIVGDEVAKAVIGTGGAESDREAIKDAFNSANSPRQLQGVIARYEGLMGGQLSGLRRQYQRATGLNDFNGLVSQLARQKLSTAGRAGASAAPGPVGPLAIGKSAKVGQFTVTRIQ
jgi:hypothetical protein